MSSQQHAIPQTEHVKLMQACAAHSKQTFEMSMHRTRAQNIHKQTNERHKTNASQPTSTNPTHNDKSNNRTLPHNNVDVQLIVCHTKNVQQLRKTCGKPMQTHENNDEHLLDLFFNENCACLPRASSQGPSSQKLSCCRSPPVDGRDLGRSHALVWLPASSSSPKPSSQNAKSEF